MLGSDGDDRQSVVDDDRDDSARDWLSKEEDCLKKRKSLLEMFAAATSHRKAIKADLERERKEQSSQITNEIEDKLQKAGLNRGLAFACLIDDANSVTVLHERFGIPKALATRVIEELRPKWNSLQDAEGWLGQQIQGERAKRIRDFCAAIPNEWKQRLPQLPQTLGSNLLIQVVSGTCSAEDLAMRLDLEKSVYRAMLKLRRPLFVLWKPEPRPSVPTVTPGGENPTKKVGSSKPKVRHQRNSEELFRAALRKHHGYESDGSVLNVEPISTRGIEGLVGISDSTAQRLLKRHFGSVEQYRDLCFSGAIKSKLVVLMGDGLHAFGTSDLTEHASEDNE